MSSLLCLLSGSQSPRHCEADSQELSLLSYIPSPLGSSSYTSGNGCRQTKVGWECQVFIVTHWNFTSLSATVGSLLYNEQPDLSVARRIQPCLQPFGLWSPFIAKRMLLIPPTAHLFASAANVSRYLAFPQAELHSSNRFRVADCGVI